MFCRVTIVSWQQTTSTMMTWTFPMKGCSVWQLESGMQNQRICLTDSRPLCHAPSTRIALQRRSRNGVPSALTNMDVRTVY